jgi:hypothetical protein
MVDHDATVTLSFYAAMTQLIKKSGENHGPFDWGVMFFGLCAV